MELLFGHFLCMLAEREPVVFFSTVSQVWLEWVSQTKDIIQYLCISVEYE